MGSCNCGMISVESTKEGKVREPNLLTIPAYSSPPLRKSVTGSEASPPKPRRQLGLLHYAHKEKRDFGAHCASPEPLHSKRAHTQIHMLLRFRHPLQIHLAYSQVDTTHQVCGPKPPPPPPPPALSAAFSMLKTLDQSCQMGLLGGSPAGSPSQPRAFVKMVTAQFTKLHSLPEHSAKKACT